MTSTYPQRIAELVPQAQLLARELGEIPSQNRLKAALHVRAERAKEVLRVLNETGFDPTADPSAPQPDLVPQPSPEPTPTELPPDPSEQVSDHAEPDSSVSTRLASGRQTWDWRRPASEPVGTTEREPVTVARPVARWPMVLLAAPAFVAIWSAWVGVGELAGFGPVRPLPGIVDSFTINSAITLPIGMEAYAAYALRVWLSETCPTRARLFAKRSAIAAFVLGALGQIAYHLMTAARLTAAPWLITAVVSCLPVVVLGFGAALVHLQQPHRVGTEGQR